MKQTSSGEKQPSGAAKPKKKNILLRLLAFLVTVAMVLGAAALVVFRDTLNLDSFRRWLTYRSLQTSSTGQTDPFTHGGGDGLDIVCLDKGYLFASSAGAYYYSSSGQELASCIVHMDAPVLSSSSKYAVVYNAGGQTAWVFGGSALSRTHTAPDSILSARVNDSGWLALTSLADHYRSSVAVSDAEGDPVITLNFSSAFVSDAVLSPDGKTVAVVAMGQTDGTFHSTLSLYSTSGETPFASVTLDGFTVLDMDFDSSGIWLLGESSLVTLSADGQTMSTYTFDPTYLKGYALEGDGFAALLLGKYRAGAARDVVTIGPDAQLIARQELDRQILSLSANGRYLAILSGQELNLYTSSLTAYSTLDNTLSARGVALHRDGSALLANSQEAWLYIPD